MGTKRVSFLVCVFVCLVSTMVLGTTKIWAFFVANGQPVRASDYPWQVALRINPDSNGFRCGGVLVGSQFVVTAAHCVDIGDAFDQSVVRSIRTRHIRVYHGSEIFGQGRELVVDPDWPVRIHPNWKTDSEHPLGYDVAVFKLAEPHGVAETAQLPSVNYSSGDAVVSGWGAFDDTDKTSEILLAAQLTLLPLSECRQTVGPEMAREISDQMLCASSSFQDACGGDSGGPLVMGSKIRPVLVGIVSWGAAKPCGTAMYNGALVGIYTRSFSVADWLYSVTGDPNLIRMDQSPIPETFAIVPIERGETASE